MNVNKTELLNAMKTGLCQDEIDIFNSEELNTARINYIESYLPSNKWNLMNDQVSLPWQFYHHVLYQKLDN